MQLKLSNSSPRWFQFKTHLQLLKYPLPRSLATKVRSKTLIYSTLLRTSVLQSLARAALKPNRLCLTRGWLLRILELRMQPSRHSFTPTVRPFCPIRRSSIGLRLRSKMVAQSRCHPRAARETLGWTIVQIQSVLLSQIVSTSTRTNKQERMREFKIQVQVTIAPN